MEGLFVIRFLIESGDADGRQVDIFSSVCPPTVKTARSDFFPAAKADQLSTNYEHSDSIK